MDLEPITSPSVAPFTGTPLHPGTAAERRTRPGAGVGGARVAELGPMGAGAASSGEGRSVGSSGRRAFEPLGAGHTVLIAEDNPEHRYLYAHVLELAGYRVLEATNGERAVALAREARPDVVVLDLGLPILDGYQVIQLLKGNALTRAIPIIVVTVYAAGEDVARVAELGCELHMAKPARPTQVLEAVDRVVGVSRPAVAGRR